MRARSGPNLRTARRTTATSECCLFSLHPLPLAVSNPVMAKLPLAEIHTPPYVYFDDSGTTPSHADKFLWAGYWASFSFWQSFGIAWNEILAEDPPISHWHQTAARYGGGWHAKPGRFSQLSREQVRARELALSRLVADNADRLHPLVMTLSHDDLANHLRGKISGNPALSANQKRIAEITETAQFVSLLWTVKHVVELQRQGDSENMPVSLVCEDRQGDPFKPFIFRIWNTVRRRDSRMGTLSFLPGKSADTPQLQVADMLAWHYTRILKDPRHLADPAWQILGQNVTGSYNIGPPHLDDHARLWWSLPFELESQ